MDLDICKDHINLKEFLQLNQNSIVTLTHFNSNPGYGATIISKQNNNSVVEYNEFLVYNLSSLI